MEESTLSIPSALNNDVTSSIHRNNYKLTADKIIQILDAVRDEAKKSRRRWIWELVQNAKDTPNIFDNVSIKIHLTSDHLTFSHNGDPFHIDNITGLIQQVSSKPSDSSDQTTTGKFGTGFITTHLLSDVVTVDGVLKRNNDIRRKFTLILDRSGDNSEDLIPNIETNLNNLLWIDEDETRFPKLADYDTNRKEESLDTVFSYPLNHQDSKKAALEGVNDLTYTLPSTLIFVDKIKKVHVINEEAGNEAVYTALELKKDGHYSHYHVRIKNVKTGTVKDMFFINYKNEDVSLLAEVKDFESLQLITPGKKEPKLYRDFPLIGTEKFHFPFTLNGLSFFPGEKRDSILLNDTKEKASHNRALLLRAKEAAIEFTDWLIKKKATNLFVLANTRTPELSIEMEDELKSWLHDYQFSWRQQLLDKPLVETRHSTISIREAILPRFSIDDELNLAFWGLSAEFFGEEKVPKEEIALRWVDAVGIIEEKTTWKPDILLDHVMLLGHIQSSQSLDALPVPGTIDKKVLWLTKLYDFLISQNLLDLLNQFRCVPNQYGKFKLLPELHKEKHTEPIADEILDIMKDLGIDWRELLINRQVLKNVPHTEKGLIDASGEINKVLSEEVKQGGITKSTFLSRINALNILVKILSLTTKEHNPDSFRSQLFLYARQFFKFAENFRNVSNLESFYFINASKLLVTLLNEAISAKADLLTLAEQLGKPQNDALAWLDSYLRFLHQSKEYNYLLNTGNIVPNQYLKLRAYEDLLNFGTKEQSLDDALIRILKEFDSNQDWKTFLPAHGVTLPLAKTATFDQLGNALMQLVAQIHTNGTEEEYRQQLLSLIEWCHSHQKLANHFLSDFVARANRIFFILTVEKSEHSEKVVSLLKDIEKIPDLVAIKESGADLKQLSQIAKAAGNPGIMKSILAHAKVLEEEQNDFDFKHKIGVNIEDLFRKALEAQSIALEIRYQGTGSRDFVLTNPVNKKEFFVEIKSYRGSNTTDPIRMSMSQAQLATTRSSQYALCIIPRPVNITDVNTEYIRTALRYIDELSSVLSKPVDDYKIVMGIASGDADISLELQDTSCKVKIRHSYIASNGKDFQALILEIKKQLQII